MIRAILIALVFVVQTFGSAYATGASSQPVLLDAFGNPLCITSGEHGGAGDDNGHDGLKDCCVLACAGVTAACATPNMVEIDAPAARLLIVLTGKAFVGLPALASFSPGNPRAPPLA